MIQRLMNLLGRFARWLWRILAQFGRWLWHFVLSSVFFILVALLVYIVYLQRHRLETEAVGAPMVALLTLLVVVFVLWRGGSSLIGRIQELGPLKLAPRVEREVERIRPEVESALQDMDRLDRTLAANLYLDPSLPPDKMRVVERALGRLSPLLTGIRLSQDPKSFSDDLRLWYGLLGYWEGRLLYHLGDLQDAIAKWDLVWRIAGPDLLRKLTSPKFRIADFCVFVGNAHELLPPQGRDLVEQRSERRAALRAAVDWYRRAIEYDPDLIPAMFNLAWAYDELGLFGRAIHTLDQLLNADPTFVEALYNRACAKTKARNLDEAMQDLSRLPCPHKVWAQARIDDDLAALRTSRHAAEFAALVERCDPAVVPLPPADR